MVSPHHPLPAQCTEVVVEPGLRDSFSPSCATPAYTRLLCEAVPPVWVGPLERLVPLVEVGPPGGGELGGLGVEVRVGFERASMTEHRPGEGQRAGSISRRRLAGQLGWGPDVVIYEFDRCGSLPCHAALTTNGLVDAPWSRRRELGSRG